MNTRKLQIANIFFLDMALTVLIAAAPKPLDAQTSIYGMISNRHADSCLQPAGGSTGVGAAIVLAPCSGGLAQSWQSMAAGPGFANFRSQLSGLCIGAVGSPANHTPVQQVLCTTSPALYWSYSHQSGADTTVYSGIDGAKKDFCLDIPGGQSTPGLAIQIYTCNGTVSQNWTYTGSYAANSVIGTIRSIAAGLCIQPDGGSISAGAAIVQRPCSGYDDPAQTWTVVSLDGLRDIYVNQLSGMCMNAWGSGDPKNHDPVQQRPCAVVSNEYWVPNYVLWQPGVPPTGPVYINSFKNHSYPNFCLDVPGGQATPGLALQVYTCNFTTSQQWE